MQAVLLLLALSGCATPLFGSAKLSVSPAVEGTPIVRAIESGSAQFTLIACPIRANGGAIAGEFIQGLAERAPLVVAEANASARLTINLCPSPPDAEMLRALLAQGQARRAAR